jgi:cellulose synthase/poly-beta-1,6-N-acetylglucosamine synthase-like glycosyltransferase
VNVVEGILVVLAWASLVYFAIVNLTYVAFTIVAWHRLAASRRARVYTPLDEMFASPFTPDVSVLLPAYNEEAGVVTSVTSLLDLRYPRHEVIVVNDGSTDRTLERLREAFDLVPVRQALRTGLITAPIRGTYVSRRRPSLLVVDKENGGKSDALNAGVNAAANRYICAVDADAILEFDSLLRFVKPIIDHPDVVVAAGGIVRIANGSVVEGGRIVQFRLPRNPLAAIQVVEYIRAFLIGRTGWNSMNALLIVSGAFGIFRRTLIEEVGGYALTVGEDIEIVVRLHAHLRARGERYRIVFVPDPVAWTEGPDDIPTLSRQRRRWQRGLGETLWRHRRMILNPRAGSVGMVTMPYFLVFEFLGAIVQLIGIPVVVLAWAIGILSVPFFLAFLVVSVLFSMLLSLAAVLLEEYAVRRHEGPREIALVVVYGLLESFGYRQLIAYFCFRGFIDLVRGRHDWGEMERRGLERPAEAPLPPQVSAP